MTAKGTPLNIWLNRAYSTSYWILGMLRDNPDGLPVRLFATHPDPDSPVLQAADVASSEPEGLAPDAYVDWALGFCVDNAIDVFMPRAGIAAISARVTEFHDLGVAVLTSPAAAVATLEDKAATYLTAEALGLPVPPWRVARSADELAVAMAELHAVLDPGERLCIKPTVGVGGAGFRILDEARMRLDDLLGWADPRVHPDTVLSVLQAAELAGEELPRLLVLPYLDDPEVSVDCLSLAGRLIAGVPRRKHGRRQVLCADSRVLEVAERVVEGYSLSYLTNTQVRMWRGEPTLLEVNARMSGGMFQTCVAGVNLPWAAVRLALGQPAGVDRPTLGGAYVTIPTMVTLPTGAPTTTDTLLPRPRTASLA